jgi:SAM-dependent methyltransferase
LPEIENIEEYFNRSAAAFDSLYSEKAQSSLMRMVNRHFRRDIYERFRLSLEHVGKYGLQTVLDVGCGSGRYELGLAELGIKRVVGVEVSPNMIRLAKQSVWTVDHLSTSVEFVNRDFMEFQTSETFDAVLAMGFFDYIRDPAPVLRRMRALASHSVVASFPSLSWYRTPIRKARYVAKRCPVYFYRPGQVAALAREVGFTRCEVLKIGGAGQDYFAVFFK